MPGPSGTTLNQNTVQETGEYAPNGVGTIRRTLAFSSAIPSATNVVIGTLPSNAVILSTSGLWTTTAFNGTTPTINVGYAADSLGAAAPAAYSAAQAPTAIGFGVLNAVAAAAAAPRAVPTTLTANITYTTTTVGSCEIIINYAMG